MGYILKDTSALLNIKLTDAGRKKIADGTFNIAYFQVGDSEVCYDCIPNADITSLNVINAQYNAQNLAPLPERSKSHIKYPLKVNSQSDNTYGIPINEPIIDNIFNTAAPKGFFTGTTTFSGQTSSGYTINPNFVINISGISSANTVTITSDVINAATVGQAQVGNFVTLFFGETQPINSNNPILTYKVINVTGDTSGNTGNVTIELDRNLPDFTNLNYSGTARAYFYPSGMTELYDSVTPEVFWSNDAINFETNCDISQFDVKVWNMNIPWTESPAGLFSSTHKPYNQFTSSGYTGTKEYLGYNSNTGQTDSDTTYYYNSYSEKIVLSPSDQKSIAIIHYTNQSIDDIYGEKFAMQEYDNSNPLDTGQARNFKLDIPWLMWHKTTGTTIGETFYVDPAGFDGLDLFEPHFIQSNVNSDMNEDGIRYYHLWDTNPNTNGYPNRVGKVFPDFKMVVIDDDELIAALSYKANRNWTLPAPKVMGIPPATFNGVESSDTGILSGSTECLWVTYRFNTTGLTNSLHCNYYTKICGNDPDCPPDTMDIAIKFGDEFPFLSTDAASGFYANGMEVLVQKVSGDTRPDPTEWKVIDVTNQLTATTVSDRLTQSGMTGTTILVTKPTYDAAGTIYDLNDYIDLPELNQTGQTLNFGDEYYFYGNIETDIQATIYVMNYMCNLGQTQFLTSQNPTWDNNYSPHISEIGLYNDEKDLMIIAKVQSPQKRQGVQQYPIKIDL